MKDYQAQIWIKWKPLVTFGNLQSFVFDVTVDLNPTVKSVTSINRK